MATVLVQLSDAAWRVVLLFALGLAPYAAPGAWLPAPSGWVVWARLAIFGAIAAGLTWVVRRSGRVYPGLAKAAVAALVVVPATSVLLREAGVPLLWGAWVATPAVWAVLASAASGPLAAWTARDVDATSARSRVRTIRAAVALLGAVGLVLAVPRLVSRDATASAYSEATSGSSPRPPCPDGAQEGCACVEARIADAIDHARFAEARSGLEASPSCASSARRNALEAEVLLGTGSVEEGAKKANLALDTDPKDPHAVYARAWASSSTGDNPTAERLAAQAIALGRGTAARLLFGQLLLRRHDFARAEATFREVLATEPEDVRATYSLAFIAGATGNYHDAREGYLRALELDPGYADARYELARITYSRGALLETRHHVDVFAASYPFDPRVPELRKMLTVPPPRRALTVGP